MNRNSSKPRKEVILNSAESIINFVKVYFEKILLIFPNNVDHQISIFELIALIIWNFLRQSYKTCSRKEQMEIAEFTIQGLFLFNFIFS